MKNVQNPIYLYLWNLYILAKIIALSFFLYWHADFKETYDKGLKRNAELSIYKGEPYH